MKHPTEFQTDAFQNGLRIRREVLGAEYVDRSVRDPDPFMVPLQKLITEYCWADIWSRPGIDRRVRSIINIAMLSALNRPNELKLHTLGALRNGVSSSEIQEILLQVAIYCGVPAALDASKIARDVVREYEAGQGVGAER